MRAPKLHGASGYPTGQSSSTALKEMLREIFAFSKWTEFKRGFNVAGLMPGGVPLHERHSGWPLANPAHKALWVRLG